MSSSEDFSRERARERAVEGEPIIEPRLLKQLEEADLPFRGKLRKRVVTRLRQETAERRTLRSLANRLANRISSPIREAIQQEARERIEKRAVDRLTEDEA